MTAVDDRPAISPEIGKDRRRKEDQRLITGRTRWTDNIALPGMLHLAMVRSPHAHAKILSIDIEAADTSLNIYEVFTGEHLAETQGVIANAWPITPDQVTPTHLPMATERVAFAGEIVAVVVARSAAEARDAAELVDVEYELLPAVLDLKEAAEDKVSRTRTWARTRPRSGSSTPRARAPVAPSTRSSPRRRPTASSSSASTASNG